MNGMPQATRRTRGEPLLVVGLIVGTWLAIRVLLWQPPFDVLGPRATWVPSWTTSADAANSGGPPVQPAREPRRARVGPRALPGPADAPIGEPLPAPWPAVSSAPDASPTDRDANAIMPRRIVGQQLLLAAAFSRMELAPEIAAYFLAGGAVASPPPSLAGESPLLGKPPPHSTEISRWSGDAWFMLRNGANAAIAGAGPSYGRSQAGVVLRYRLAPSNGHRPIIYARATGGVTDSREREVAAGLAARPISGLPLSLAGEMRITEGHAGREVRPAAFAVTELPRARLPLGLRGEAYVEAGYVGGHFATPFVDGQARLDMRVGGIGKETEVRAGGGVWGGAERHAARLDVGPTAALSFRLGDAPSRLAVDYRWRVAGDAAPQSGPAFTFSAGF